MNILKRDWNGLQFWFLETCSPNSFSKFGFVVCNVWCSAWEAYLFHTKPAVISSFKSSFSSFIANKERRNEVVCRDTALLRRVWLNKESIITGPCYKWEQTTRNGNLLTQEVYLQWFENPFKVVRTWSVQPCDQTEHPAGWELMRERSWVTTGANDVENPLLPAPQLSVSAGWFG